MIQQGETYLVTTDNWFYGTDGNMYCAVFGTARMFEAKPELGFVPTKSANWFVQIGYGEEYIIIAGCQIHYLLRTNSVPIQKTGSYLQKDTGKEIPFNSILILK